MVMMVLVMEEAEEEQEEQEEGVQSQSWREECSKIEGHRF